MLSLEVGTILSCDSSNLNKLDKENFSTFNLNKYSNEVDFTKYNVNISPQENMRNILKIIKKGEEIIRTAIGINDRGELIVQDAEGNTEHIFSGEVSVRGIYGYV